jgi:hypothetical protein
VKTGVERLLFGWHCCAGRPQLRFGEHFRTSGLKFESELLEGGSLESGVREKDSFVVVSNRLDRFGWDDEGLPIRIAEKECDRSRYPHRWERGRPRFKG